jgi:hypothetical protein
VVSRGSRAGTRSSDRYQDATVMTCVLWPIHQVAWPVIDPVGCPEEPSTHRPRPALQRGAVLGLGLISTVGLLLAHGAPPMPACNPRPKRPTEKVPVQPRFLRASTLRDGGWAYVSAKNERPLKCELRRCKKIAHRCKEKPLDEASEAIMRARPNPFLETQGYRFGSLVIVARIPCRSGGQAPSGRTFAGRLVTRISRPIRPPSPRLLDGVV